MTKGKNEKLTPYDRWPNIFSLILCPFPMTIRCVFGIVSIYLAVVSIADSFIETLIQDSSSKCYTNFSFLILILRCTKKKSLIWCTHQYGFVLFCYPTLGFLLFAEKATYFFVKKTLFWFFLVATIWRFLIGRWHSLLGYVYFCFRRKKNVQKLCERSWSTLSIFCWSDWIDGC